MLYHTLHEISLPSVAVFAAWGAEGSVAGLRPVGNGVSLQKLLHTFLSIELLALLCVVTRPHRLDVGGGGGGGLNVRADLIIVPVGRSEQS